MNLLKNNGIEILNSENPELQIIFSGDLCPVDGYEEIFSGGKVTEYMPQITGICSKADLHITNLEAPLSKDNTPILKCGPNFGVFPECTKGLHELSITHACLANNHTKDLGEKSLLDTIDVLNNTDIVPLGYAKGEEQVMEPMFFEKNGVKIMLLNAAEAEFSYPEEESYGASFLNEVEIIKILNESTKEADITILSIHAGREYKFFPACFLRKMYRNFISAGASAVIAHHPHVPQGIEIYQEGLICYSLGNFIFDREGMHSKIGPDLSFLIDCGFSKNGLTNFTIHPIKRLHDNKVVLMDNSDKSLFFEFMDKVSTPLSDEQKAKLIWDEYCRGDLELYMEHLKMCSGKYPFGSDQESKEAVAYLFSVISMSQTHKQMLKRIIRLILDSKTESDEEYAKLISEWNHILSKIKTEHL